MAHLVAPPFHFMSMFPTDPKLSLLNHNELDLVIIRSGSVMSLVNTHPNRESGKHKPTKRKRSLTTFLHNGQHVCQKPIGSFLALQLAVKESYFSNGSSTFIYGNAGKVHHNATSFQSIWILSGLFPTMQSRMPCFYLGKHLDTRRMTLKYYYQVPARRYFYIQ